VWGEIGHEKVGTKRCVLVLSLPNKPFFYGSLWCPWGCWYVRMASRAVGAMILAVLNETGRGGAVREADGGGGEGTTQVDTVTMDQASNNLVDLRGNTDTVDNVADDDSLAASRGLNKHSGGGPAEDGSWATAGALVTMDVRWGDQVINLKNMLQSISEKLHDTRGNYTAREEHERSEHYRAAQSDFG
jgi:hypothetical protein